MGSTRLDLGRVLFIIVKVSLTHNSVHQEIIIINVKNGDKYRGYPDLLHSNIPPTINPPRC